MPFARLNIMCKNVGPMLIQSGMFWLFSSKICCWQNRKDLQIKWKIEEWKWTKNENVYSI